MQVTSENKPASPPDFYFVGGHAALDFANTVLAANGAPLEMLNSYADVLRWLRAAHLLEHEHRFSLPNELPAAKERAQLLKQISELRFLWKTALERLVAGKNIAPELLAFLNRHLKEDLSWQHLSPHSKGKGFEIHRVHVPLDPSRKILALLSAQVADFLAHANWNYLRQCAGSDCVIYFYDTTKNHRRQWCSMAVCGNRHKVATFRKKRS